MCYAVLVHEGGNTPHNPGANRSTTERRKNMEMKGMTNLQTEAMLELVKIVIELSQTKEDEIKYIERVQKILKKEPTGSPQK